MTTKSQYIAQARAANPKPQYTTINEQQIELTEDEYEASLEAWAEMRLAQDRLNSEDNPAFTGIKKLKALGLTDDEIEALVG